MKRRILALLIVLGLMSATAVPALAQPFTPPPSEQDTVDLVCSTSDGGAFAMGLIQQECPE